MCLTICSITPAVTPPAMLKAAGKLRRPAPRAAFTTMKTAPKQDTPPVPLVSVSRCCSVSMLGLRCNQALSPALILPIPAQSSTSVLMAMASTGRRSVCSALCTQDGYSPTLWIHKEKLSRKSERTDSRSGSLYFMSWVFSSTAVRWQLLFHSQHLYRYDGGVQ